MNRTDSLFYSRTRKKKKCQLWGSVKTPTGFDNMKWTKKRLLEYIARGNKVYVTSEYSVNNTLREKLGIVLTNIYHLRYVSGVNVGHAPHLLTEELFDALPSHSQKRVFLSMNANLNCFEATYNSRLDDYRRARDALGIENAN